MNALTAWLGPGQHHWRQPDPATGKVMQRADQGHFTALAGTVALLRADLIQAAPRLQRLGHEHHEATIRLPQNRRLGAAAGPKSVGLIDQKYKVQDQDHKKCDLGSFRTRFRSSGILRRHEIPGCYFHTTHIA